MRFWLASFLGFALVGCAVSPRAPAPTPPLFELSIRQQLYIGDRVTLTRRRDGPAEDVAVVLRNERSGAKRDWTIPGSAASYELPLDAEHLPGIDPEVHPYERFGIEMRWGGRMEGTSFSVILDREVLPPPSVPLGKVPGPGMGLPEQAEIEDTLQLAANVIAPWEGRELCVSSRPVSYEEVKEHDRWWEGHLQNYPLREFVVRGDFPRRVATSFGTARETTVLTPKGLRFVIVESKPSHLLMLEPLTQAPEPAASCEAIPEPDKVRPQP